MKLYALNAGPTSIFLDLGVAEVGNLDIQVAALDTGSVTRTGYPRDFIGFHTGGNVVLEKGEEYRSNMLLGRWFEISAPGRYEVVVEFTGTVTTTASEPVEIQRHFVLPLRVLPRDPRRLREVAHALVERSCQKFDFGEVYEASQILSSIDDPIVVPLLAELLDCSFIAQTAAAAQLGNLGTNEAITALLEAARSEDENLAELAQHVLGSLLVRKGASIPPALRAQMEEVVAVEKVGGEHGGDDGQR